LIVQLATVINALPLPEALNCVPNQGKHRLEFIRSALSKIPKIRAQEHARTWVIGKIAKIVNKVLRPMMQSTASPSKMS
jgi:hypothetical protein